MKNKALIIVGIFILLGVIFAFSGINMYNGLVTMDEGVNASWSKLESSYQRRADLIPNLVNTVKGYADFEQQTLVQVIEARSKATSVNISADNLNAETFKQFQSAQDGLSSALSRLLVTIERYPDLKANQNFLELQAQLEGTENRINVERNRYTETAKDFNAAIRKFPKNLLASSFGFEQKPYFESQEGAEKAPEVKF